MRCPACGEYDGVIIHHGHDAEADCPEGGPCHSYCRNCDYGTCGED